MDSDNANDFLSLCHNFNSNNEHKTGKNTNHHNKDDLSEPQPADFRYPSGRGESAPVSALLGVSAIMAVLTVCSSRRRMFICRNSMNIGICFGISIRIRNKMQTVCVKMSISVHANPHPNHEYGYLQDSYVLLRILSLATPSNF